MIFLSPIAIPENLDYALYFNLLFFGIIALAAFFGFVQGFKRSLWGLIFKIIFVIIFFLTINSASNFIYNADISSILAMIPESMFDFGGASSINDVVISQISAALEVEPEMISGNEDILALVVSLSLFVIKIIYTILYFTVFAVIYKFITFILRLFIIKRKKGKSKLRLLGIIPGALRGVVSVFLMLIIFGGLFDIIGGVSSIASILAE
ncbi:MAG: hypothetical protein WCY80_02300, partial [Candidatus Izemoplasmatales bacterium]